MPKRFLKDNDKGRTLRLSVPRKKNRGENLKAWRERQMRKAELLERQMDVLRETAPLQYLRAIQAAGGHDGISILPDISKNSSTTEQNFNEICQGATSSSHIPSSSPSVTRIKQEPDEDGFSTNEHCSSSSNFTDSSIPNDIPTSDIAISQGASSLQSSPVTRPSSSHSPYGSAARQEPEQNSSLSSENSLPNIKHSFSLAPSETPDLSPSGERNNTDLRFNLLGRNWAEKMKFLRPDQRIYAEKLINDVLFEAELCRLKHGCHVENSA